MQKVSIMLGDLRHSTLGKHSASMPIGIGYIAAYALAQMKKNAIEMQLYTEPNDLIEVLAEQKPVILALSNYCWNSELSYTILKYAKKMNPSILCIAGGPNFPTDLQECEEYLLERPAIDFYIRYEAELAFCHLLKRLLEIKDIELLKRETHPSVMSIHPQTKKIMTGELISRPNNMDDIPSPYLTGLMDPWFTGEFAPAIETVRGCPFTCAFCYASQKWYSRMNAFSTDRVIQELNYICQRMTKFPDVMLMINDSNFGMFEKDEIIAKHIRKLQDTVGWPNAFNVTTGKKKYDRILRVAALLKNRMIVSCAVQSMNSSTLDVINRKNLSLSEYKSINAEIKKRGMPSDAELIAPMPLESKESFFEGLRAVIDVINVDRVIQYTTMLLPGTYLASMECRNKYGMKTKYRIVPRQFGEYAGEKCFEIEEVCISTNTMPFEDYLELRGYALISYCFMNEQFSLVHKYLREQSVSLFDFVYTLWDTVRKKDNLLNFLYEAFITETQDELWESKEALVAFYSQPQNYEMLLTGELADNLIRKYTTLFFSSYCAESISLACDIAYAVSGRKGDEKIVAIKEYMQQCRNVQTVFFDMSDIDEEKLFSLKFDVFAWEKDNSNAVLADFKKDISYVTSIDMTKIRSIFNEAELMYGKDKKYQIGKILVNWTLANFWRQCSPICNGE